MNNGDNRGLRVLLGVIAGSLIADVGWMLPAAEARGEHAGLCVALISTAIVTVTIAMFLD